MTAPYRFDRYKNGTKMAEGIKVTKESCFFDAIKVAARLADPGDVLVYDADVSDALVAAAYEAAGDAAADAYDAMDLPYGSDVAGFVRSLTLADARAALDRIRQEAREEALREAAVICNQSYGGSIGDVHKAILALITKDADNG